MLAPFALTLANGADAKAELDNSIHLATLRARIRSPPPSAVFVLGGVEEGVIRVSRARERAVKVLLIKDPEPASP